jgi:hypothetical protein
MGFNSVNDQIGEAVEDSQEKNYLVGVVVDNADPLGQNRIKVKVPNFWDPAEGEIPWVGPHPYSPFGIGEGYGTYGSPAVGSEVRVHLQNSDANYGLYEASHYSKPNPKFSSPHTWGFKDPSGNELWVNMETNAWEFTHSSGTTLKYNAQGDQTLTIVRDENVEVGRNATKTVAGDEATTVMGDAAKMVQGNLSIVVQGNVDIASSGTVTITGSQINLN